MNQITIFVLLVFSLAVTSESAISAPIVKLKTDYYLITGGTANEIRSNIDRKTPVRVNGTNYDAHTAWFVKWNYWWDQSNGSCAVTKAETKVNIQFILPKLETSSTLPKALRQKWETYMKALLRHEDGHKNIGVRAANEIESEILNMASRQTCKQLDIDANRIGNETLGKFRAIEKEYDRRSNFGMNDGAMFP